MRRLLVLRSAAIKPMPVADEAKARARDIAVKRDMDKLRFVNLGCHLDRQTCHVKRACHSVVIKRSTHSSQFGRTAKQGCKRLTVAKLHGTCCALYDFRRFIGTLGMR